MLNKKLIYNLKRVFDDISEKLPELKIQHRRQHLINNGKDEKKEKERKKAEWKKKRKVPFYGTFSANVYVKTAVLSVLTTF